MLNSIPRPQVNTNAQLALIDTKEDLDTLTNRSPMPKNIDKHAQTGYQEEPRILRQRTIPSRLDRVHIKPLLSQLSRILTEDGRCAGLEQRKGQDSPEHPWQLEDLPEFELFVLLRQLLVSGCITSPVIMLVAIPTEEPEDRCRGIGKEVHEDSRPEDPGKVARVLRTVNTKSSQLFCIRLTFAITFAVDFPTNPPI